MISTQERPAISTAADDGLAERIEARGNRLFADEQFKACASVDRMFAWLLAGQWLASIVLAVWVSPLAWEGARSSINIHVIAAVFLGGAITLFPVMMAVLRPGSPLTRHVIAVGQALWSALLIHLTGGRIETHFHVFGSLAILAFYRDWRVMITSTVVVAADHVLRGLFWPQSVYGVLTAAPWRAIEHAGWVVFEDVFLLLSIRRNLAASRDAANKRAQVEAGREFVELEVEQRTRELSDSELRFRSLSVSSPIGIFETDTEGRPLYYNPELERILGMTVAAAGGGGWVRALHPDDQETVMREWQACVRDRRGFSLEYRIRRADGDLRWVHGRSAPILDSAGETRGYVGTVEDVTERKQFEADLLAARESALQAARTKSEFLANMSHEIRTPMASIIGLTELALETTLTREQSEYLGTVRGSAESLLSLLNDILDFSKIEAGKLELESIPMGLRECVGGALKSTAIRAHQKGLELVCNIGSEVPDRLIGDPGRLRQVIVNLVGNAIKFTAHGEVVVTVEVREDSEEEAALAFSVTDTGIGIPKDKQGLIFGAFTQVDGSTTRKFGGTGLGLAICSQLVSLMGGEIVVDSEPGRGSTFGFVLRLGVDHSPARVTPPVPRELIRDKRVLVVDDNATNRSIFTVLLDGWGARPLAVDGGLPALAALRHARQAGMPFDLVMLDVNMPGMDGIAVAEQVQRDPGTRVPILVLTSSGAPGDIARCRTLGVAGYLTKPVLSDDLLTALWQIFAGAPDEAAPLVTGRAAERGPQWRLLLAEDNTVNRKMVTRMLEQRGHTVTAVADGLEALAALQHASFDAILMDVQMPNLDGFETTARIRAEEHRTDRHLPIVALTAHAMKGDRERCMASGMDAYASKPIRPTELFATLERLVSGSSQPPAANEAPEADERPGDASDPREDAAA